MNCHIIPQVYLKSWKVAHTKKTIYLFDKMNIHLHEEHNISNLKNTTFTQKDIFIIDLKTALLLEETVKDLEEMFANILIKYDIKINNLNLTESDLLKKIRNIYFGFDTSSTLNIINKSNNKTIHKQHFFKILEEEWRRYSKTIENKFSENLENDWDSIIHNINESNKEKIIEFLLVLFYKQNLNVDSQIENLYKVIGKPLLDRFNQHYNVNNPISSLENFKELQKKQTWIRYLKTSRTNPMSRALNDMKKWNYKMFVLYNNNIDFITSDNPCFYINTKDAEFNNIFNGLYFPVKPSMCLYLLPDPKNKLNQHYYTLSVEDDLVQYINYMILKKSNKYVVSNNINLSQNISNTINMNIWIDTFKNIGISIETFLSTYFN